jgi:hypothetical protein
MKKALKDFKLGECFRFTKTGSVYYVSQQYMSISKTAVRMVNDGLRDTRRSDLLVFPVDVETL